MKIWNNIFAASYNYFERIKNQDQRFGALSIVGICIMTISFLLIIMLGKVLGQNLFLKFLPNKYYIIPFILLEIYLLNKYYSHLRIDKIMSKFNSLSTTKQDIWKLATMIFVVGPIIAIGFILKK